MTGRWTSSLTGWCALLVACHVDLGVPSPVADYRPERVDPSAADVLLGPELPVVLAGERVPDAIVLGSLGREWLAVRGYPDELAMWRIEPFGGPVGDVRRIELERTGLAAAPADAARLGEDFVVAARPWFFRLRSVDLVPFDIQRLAEPGVVTRVLPWDEGAVGRVRSCTCCFPECTCEYVHLTADAARGIDVEPLGTTCAEDIALLPETESSGMPVDAIDRAVALASNGSAIVSAQMRADALVFGVEGRWEGSTRLVEDRVLVDVSVAAGEHSALVAWRERGPVADCTTRVRRLRLADGAEVPFDGPTDTETVCEGSVIALRVPGAFLVMTPAKHGGGLAWIADDGAASAHDLPEIGGAPCLPVIAAAGGAAVRFVCEGSGGFLIRDATTSLDAVPMPLADGTEPAPSLPSNLHAACGPEECLVVYGEHAMGFGIRVRKPDGAVLDLTPIELGRGCHGPAAAAHRGYVVSCGTRIARVSSARSVVHTTIDSGEVADVIWNGDAYLVATRVDHIPILLRVPAATDGEIERTGCCDEHAPVASDLQLHRSDAGPVMFWTSNAGQGLFVTRLTPDARRARDTITLTNARPWLRSSAVAASTLVAATDAASFVVDLATSEVRTLDPLDGQTIDAVHDSYFLVSSTAARATATRIESRRLDLRGVPIADRGVVGTWRETRGGHAVVPLGPTKLMLVFGSPLYTRIVELAAE